VKDQIRIDNVCVFFNTKKESGFAKLLKPVTVLPHRNMLSELALASTGCYICRIS